MAHTNSTYHDLARLVYKKLTKTNYPQPSESILHHLFENLFFTSLKTEEGQLIKVTVTFIDPADPDPSPPERIVADRWNYIHFRKRIPFTVKNIVKLSKAADPWSSSLAVYYDSNDELFIWGMIDQAVHYQDFLNYETDSGSEQPGLFQTTISDIGSIYVMLDYELIATLKQNTLISNYVDVFRRGTVNKILKLYSEPYKKEITNYIKKQYKDENPRDWHEYIETSIIQSLSRILLKTQSYHNGGAFLITPYQKAGLNVKHELSYDRLFRAIINYIQLNIAHYKYANAIAAEFSKDEKNLVPVSLYVSENVSEAQKKETSDEIKGAIRFISSLSCIDGLVVLTTDLKVRGFGTVIRSKPLPEYIYVAKSATVCDSKVTPISPNQFGTRHNSMFSYCWSNKGSLGFVVSQDGDIRAITRVEDKLVMWENIKVQQFIKSDKISKPLNINIKE
ncbi:hypothetical protein H8B13_02410 [Hymenobacter sp. BT188]|uniref:putative sensor domain DACNV-containing protein n=1 Tax=Hymenobacter sp. BT188 TaxID=2763504 RepID=UPI0016516770|nr:hypothetical protein [Hymenobacter sp. BT188]MBC6605662.1 hypothetical protein [Hymenobacter sp. BT188]